jgi:hypothetical protein
MFSDDDIVNGFDVNIIIEKIQQYKNYDLLLVNASVYNLNFSEIIQNKFIEYNDSEGDNSQELFDRFISYLSFFGGCIISRSYWIKSEPEKYYGSLFVHIGVIFSSISIKWYWISEPFVKIRYGNASWQKNSLEVWLTLWPNLLTKLNNINRSKLAKHISLSPFSHFKKFILFKALGLYNNKKAKNVFKLYNNIYLIIIQYIVSIIPQRICYFISLKIAIMYNKKTILYDLKHFKA